MEVEKGGEERSRAVAMSGCGEGETGPDDKLSWNGTWEGVKSYICGDVRLHAHVRTSGMCINSHTHAQKHMPNTGTPADNTTASAPFTVRGSQTPTHRAKSPKMTKVTKSTQSQTELWSQHEHDISWTAFWCTCLSYKWTTDYCWVKKKKKCFQIYKSSHSSAKKQVGGDILVVQGSKKEKKIPFILHKDAVRWLVFREFPKPGLAKKLSQLNHQ